MDLTPSYEECEFRKRLTNPFVIVSITVRRVLVDKEEDLTKHSHNLIGFLLVFKVSMSFILINEYLFNNMLIIYVTLLL